MSLLPIPAIMRDRVARSTVSAIVCPCKEPQEAHCRQQTTREVFDMFRLDSTRRRGTGLVGPVKPAFLRGPRCRIEPRRCGGRKRSISAFACDPRHERCRPCIPTRHRLVSGLPLRLDRTESIADA